MIKSSYNIVFTCTYQQSENFIKYYQNNSPWKNLVLLLCVLWTNYTSFAKIVISKMRVSRKILLSADQPPWSGAFAAWQSLRNLPFAGKWSCILYFQFTIRIYLCSRRRCCGTHRIFVWSLFTWYEPLISRNGLIITKLRSCMHVQPVWSNDYITGLWKQIR